MAKEKMIHFRTSEEMEAQIKKAADKDKRSISDFIRIALKNYLDKLK